MLRIRFYKARLARHARKISKEVIAAPVIVYASCNPATQAQGLALLNEKYDATKIQPVDMFPHRLHV